MLFLIGLTTKTLFKKPEIIRNNLQLYFRE